MVHMVHACYLCFNAVSSGSYKFFEGLGINGRGCMVSRYVMRPKTEKAAGTWEHSAKMEGNKEKSSIEPAGSYLLGYMLPNSVTLHAPKVYHFFFVLHKLHRNDKL